MLRITIDPSEQWDEEREELVYPRNIIISDPKEARLFQR